MSKRVWQRYIRYGVIQNEQELCEVWELTNTVAREIFPGEFTLEDSNISRSEEEKHQLDLLCKFNTGFLEGCTFQTILVCMRMLEAGIHEEAILSILDISKEVLEEIKQENKDQSSI